MKKSNLFLAFVSLSIFVTVALSAQEYKSNELNGITLSYRITGKGEPLVLLHGFGGTGEVWNSVIEELSDKYRLIIPDLRGHGRSTNPSGIFTHRQSALDIYALLDKMGIKTFKAMGISTGGMTLIHMATTQRDRIESMVLIGATTYFPEQARVIMRKSSPDSLTQKQLESRSRNHSGGVEQARELMRQFNNFQYSYEDMNFTPPLLSTIKARTLIIHGDRDEFFPVSIPVEEYKSIPESFLWIVPNGGHVPLFNSDINRKYLVHTVLQFLNNNPGSWE